MTQYQDERTAPITPAPRRIAEVFVEAGGPGTPWTLDRVFAVFTDGSQDLVLTSAPDEPTPTRALLGLTAAQVRTQFGPLRLPN